MHCHGSEETKRNTDIRQGQWKHKRGEVKPWWGNLTDDDVDHMAGEYNKLIGCLQECYGYSPQHIASAVDQRLREYDRVAREQAGVLEPWSKQQFCVTTWVFLCLYVMT